ncbi:IucA/IucC family protein [Gilvimarinus agarilyticus]|uniref:IucA/IucC family protein n=1 Tax=Gilvimarinus agarilyticus TaxID=679259 RepID=UPI000699220F|nr:IucA/IucC family protein [Gilvimarinus agarilyticus]
MFEAAKAQPNNIKSKTHEALTTPQAHKELSSPLKGGLSKIRESNAQRIVRQALEAALFEGLVDYIYVPGKTERWGTVYFSLHNTDYRCRGRVRGFARVRLDLGGLTRVQRTSTSTSAEHLLEQLLDALPAELEARTRFAQELSQTRRWCDWNSQHNPTQPLCRRGLAFAELEMAMTEGHPYHPCFKARIGFSEEDHRRFSPESASPITLHWLAIPNGYVVCSGEAERRNDFYHAELGATGFATLQARARARGVDPHAVTFVPVHPWQWQQCLVEPFRKTGAAIVDLGQPGDDYWASQSVRTLINRQQPAKADIKLPLNIINTSAPRHLLSHGIESGPALSQWLAATVEQDSFFQQYPLVILREYAGIRVKETELFANHDPAICQLGALWRESIARHQKPNEAAVPLMALALIEQDGKPFIDPWVQGYGLTPWLTQLLDTLIFPVWHLLAHHGIGLEAHGQNTILLHQNGWPARLAARDFHESVEYVDAFLANPDTAPDFAQQARYAHAKPDEYYWMKNIEALRELAMDTLFVFHLSELALLLDEHYGLNEARFWAMVSDCLARYREAGHCNTERLDQLGYQAPMINVESLLRKKLCADGQEYHHRVFNPLSQDNGQSITQEVPDAVLPR